jgi:MFS family permease
MRKNLVLIFIFIDVLGFSLILPLLPYYAGTFEATPTVVGLLLGADAATQLIGASIIGRPSDRRGRQFVQALPLGYNRNRPPSTATPDRRGRCTPRGRFPVQNRSRRQR